MRGSLAACAVYRVRLASSGCALSFSLTIPYHTLGEMSTTFFSDGEKFLRVKRALHFCRSRRWPDLSRLDRAALPALTAPRRDPPSRTCRLLTYHDTGGGFTPWAAVVRPIPGMSSHLNLSLSFQSPSATLFFSPRTPLKPLDLTASLPLTNPHKHANIKPLTLTPSQCPCSAIQ